MTPAEMCIETVDTCTCTKITKTMYVDEASYCTLDTGSKFVGLDLLDHKSTLLHNRVSVCWYGKELGIPRLVHSF